MAMIEHAYEIDEHGHFTDILTALAWKEWREAIEQANRRRRELGLFTREELDR